MFNILLLLLSHTINCKSDNEEIIDYGFVNIANQLVLINMIKGDLQATNSTYFELKWKGRMRIILESIWGDADLYLSYKSVSFLFTVKCFEILCPFVVYSSFSLLILLNYYYLFIKKFIHDNLLLKK